MEQDRVLGKRILLVDDQPEVRETVRLLLGLDKHTVIDVGTGRAALEILAHDQFDLVITDYAMPGMRGDELARTIKHSAPFQPILMVTGSAECSNASGYSVDAMLRKPFSIGDLRRAIADLLCPLAEFAGTHLVQC